MAKWGLGALIALLAVVLLVLAPVLLLDSAATIDYYRVSDDRTLVIGAGTGPSFWARITALSENPESVVVGVRAVRLPVASTSSQVTELTVVLQEPIGNRRVIDSESGRPVPLR